MKRQTQRVWVDGRWKTAPLVTAYIGSADPPASPVTIHVPDVMLAEIHSHHRAYAMRGFAAVVAVWDDDAKIWAGCAYVEQFGTGAVIKGAPEGL